MCFLERQTLAPCNWLRQQRLAGKLSLQQYREAIRYQFTGEGKDSGGHVHKVMSQVLRIHCTVKSEVYGSEKRSKI